MAEVTGTTAYHCGHGWVEADAPPLIEHVFRCACGHIHDGLADAKACRHAFSAAVAFNAPRDGSAR